ncbi:MAG: mechanosensitive ion channel [Planctomycetaceae bacterium]
MLIGIYIALKVSGLSRLAMTVLGERDDWSGVWICLQRYWENYLASVLISLNRPFRVGDLIELVGEKGFVRRVTTRGTLLLTVDGNHIQIPNSTVYKAVVTNYSSSPRIRSEFTVGIGYDDSVTEAQRVILEVLNSNEAVLDDPAPLVLVDSLGASTVNLISYFWLDGSRFDAPSVCSVLMRQAKTALSEANISMPDEAREIIFPSGVPVQMTNQAPAAPEFSNSSTEIASLEPHVEKNSIKHRDKATITDAEGSLRNIDSKIQQHAAQSESSTEENLID